MRYLSVCSGIEAASVAWHPLGWESVAFAEIDKFPRAVLKHHYPGVPNWGDLTKFREWPDANVDLLVGGTPCQSFSVAGLRAGLADPRGNLALTYIAVARRYRPRWVVWENVPGVLSSDDGRAFGSFLSGLAGWDVPIPEGGWQNSGIVNAAPGCYGLAWGSLDAQYAGLAQRRLRVFVVGHLGDWRRAAAVLFERESLSGHPAPRREAGEDAAKSLRGRANASHREDSDTYVAATLRANGGSGGRFDQHPMTVVSTGDISHCLNAGGMGRIDYETETLIAHSLRADGFDASEDGTGRGTPLVPIGFYVKGDGADGSGIAPTMRGMPNQGASSMAVALQRCQVPAVAFDTTQITSAANYSNPKPGDPCHPLSAGAHAPAVAFDARQSDVLQYVEKTGPLDTCGFTMGIQTSMQVRRLTPVECCRLQGFPDTYLDIIYRGKPAADGPKYKALGNSMAVPVMRWIGERIQLVEDVLAELEEQSA